MQYIALIHKDEDSIYGVSFPDFPGCVSAGETLDESVANSSEALRGHMQLMEADGEEVPFALSLEEITRDYVLNIEFEVAGVSLTASRSN